MTKSKSTARTQPTSEHDIIDLFEPLRRDSTLVDLVAQQIEEMIHQGRLVPGDLLPPERELVRQFNVSRMVIREAIARLMGRNLLEARTTGMYVTSPSMAAISQSILLMLRAGNELPDMAKIMEVRRLLEVEIAGLAALRRDNEDIALLQSLLDEAQSTLDDTDRFPELDVEFHRALASATHNELFVILIDALRETLIRSRRTGRAVPGTPERALSYHREIFAQVVDRSVDGARAAMTAHMDEAEQTLQSAARMLSIAEE